jgi:hypothetical protein
VIGTRRRHRLSGGWHSGGREGAMTIFLVLGLAGLVLGGFVSALG